MAPVRSHHRSFPSPSSSSSTPPSSSWSSPPGRNRLFEPICLEFVYPRTLGDDNAGKEELTLQKGLCVLSRPDRILNNRNPNGLMGWMNRRGSDWGQILDFAHVTFSPIVIRGIWRFGWCWKWQLTHRGRFSDWRRRIWPTHVLVMATEQRKKGFFFWFVYLPLLLLGNEAVVAAWSLWRWRIQIDSCSI